MGNTSGTTAIAVTDKAVVDKVAGWSGEHLAPFYHGKNYDAWKADVALAIAQNKDLRDCLFNEMDTVKLVRSLQLNAASGLSLNPQLGQAALVVYDGKKGRTVNHLVMKNGLVKKAMETRKVIKVESGTVYDNDDFKPVKSSDGDGYKWDIAIENRGKPKGYFAYIHLVDGKNTLEYWTLEQVREHAAKYGNGKKWDDVNKKYLDEFKPDSAWGKYFDGMAEKTVIRAALNNLYLPELDEIFAVEDRQIEQMRDVTEPPLDKGTGADDLAAALANQNDQIPAVDISSVNVTPKQEEQAEELIPAQDEGDGAEQALF